MADNELLNGLYIPDDETAEEMIPTPRRTDVMVQPPKLTPPPPRLGENESRRVDLKSILSEPPSAMTTRLPSIPPPPRVPHLTPPSVVSFHPDDWATDRTPPPLSSNAGSYAPMAVSEAPDALPTRSDNVWKVSTIVLAAALGVVAAAGFGLFRQARPAAPSVAHAPPPHYDINELPIVGVANEEPVAQDTAEPVAKPKPLININEVSIGALARREVAPERSGTDSEPASPMGLGRTETPAPATASAESGDGTVIPPEDPSVNPEVASAEEVPKLAPFDRDAAAAAMNAAAANAVSCRQPDSPAGTARVAVTFAPSGRVTTALVSGTFAGTPVGGCIARTFRAVRVPAYEGGIITVHRTTPIR